MDKKKKGYLEKIKKMFPSDSEIDHYFREIFFVRECRRIFGSIYASLRLRSPSFE